MLYSRNNHNIVKQLYSNKDIFKKEKFGLPPTRGRELTRFLRKRAMGWGGLENSKALKLGK